jgi:lipoprotein-anchoring transpeptidase ErfK/SrfK
MASKAVRRPYPHPQVPPPAPRRPLRPPQRTARSYRAAAHTRPRTMPAGQIAAPSLPVRPMLPRPRRATSKSEGRWLLIALVGAPLVFALVALVIVGMGALFIFGGGRVLPGVSVAGMNVGGLSEVEAAAQLAQMWAGRGIVLRDGAAVYPISAEMLGITLDASASAHAARDYGRSGATMGGALRAAFGQVSIAPVVAIDANAFAQGLEDAAPQINTPARNAGVQFVNGAIEPRAASEGRTIDITATLAAVQAQGSDALTDGEIDLVMNSVAPSVTDPAPILAAANALLAAPLEIRAYNPVTDTTASWSLPPQTWLTWLDATGDETQPTGLALALDNAALTGYIEAQSATLGQGESINIEESVAAVQAALRENDLAPTIRVYNADRPHVVQSGESITSIAWDYGVPYLYIQQANPGIDAGLSVGQTIMIPSADDFLELPIVADKRIEVSISEQRVRVYEGGQLRWDWIASTGISSSPTWTGIYQIISHETNAYAGNWDLYMPNFMGVYRPIPGADFTNGFHGFPTRGGSQLLWTNSLGSRVTYGCILLSDENIQQLYEWAEEGVVVEITG